MAAHQAPLSLGFSRQEYWSGVPLPSAVGTIQRGNLVLNYLEIIQLGDLCRENFKYIPSVSLHICGLTWGEKILEETKL